MTNPAHKILIVEDEEALLKGLELNLAREGYQILTASSGEEGMRLALRENPHLVLLDIMLPGMNGLDVCRELRSKGFDAPIIMLTAKSEEVDRVVGLEIGADDYVTKPFSRRELLARIRVRLRRQPVGSSEQLARYRFDQIEIDFEKCCASKSGKLLAARVRTPFSAEAEIKTASRNFMMVVTISSHNRRWLTPRASG